MIDLVRNRRSIRSYTGEPVDKETLELLIEVLLRAPTSRGINPWEFVVVDDRQVLGELSVAKASGAAFLKDAAVGIVICADSTKSDVWVEDCSISAVLLQMAAQSLGLGSCWIQIRNRQHVPDQSSEQYIQQLLGLPEQIKVECIISIGHPAEKRAGVTADELQYNKIRHNRYSSNWERTSS